MSSINNDMMRKIKPLPKQPNFKKHRKLRRRPSVSDDNLFNKNERDRRERERRHRGRTGDKKIYYSLAFRIGDGDLRVYNDYIFVVPDLSESDIRDTIEHELLIYLKGFNLQQFATFHQYFTRGLLDADSDTIHILKIIIKKDDLRLTGSLGGMTLSHVLFNKSPLNIKSNDDVINSGYMCVPHYIIETYKNKKGCVNLVKYFTANNKIYTVDELIEQLEYFKIPFHCLDVNLHTYKELINKKKQVKNFIFMVSNNHIYPIEHTEHKALKTTQ